MGGGVGNPTRNEGIDELGNLPRGLSPDTCPILNPQALSPKTVPYLIVDVFISVMKLHFLFATSSFVSGNGFVPFFLYAYSVPGLPSSLE